MPRLLHVGKFGRRVPLWVRCLALGLAVSWVVAMGHWFLIETGAVPRFNDEDRRTSLIIDPLDAGVPIVESMHRAYHGYPPYDMDPKGRVYTVIAYGWPIRNWGTVFAQHNVFVWQTGVEPAFAINVRRVWPESNFSDPKWPLTKQQIAAQCATGVCPPTNGTDAYQRYLPVFPLVLQSMMASVIYGVPFYIVFRWRDARRRRGSCVGCGYDLSSLPAATVCPECGKARSVRPAKKAVSPLA